MKAILLLRYKEGRQGTASSLGCLLLNTGESPLHCLHHHGLLLRAANATGSLASGESLARSILELLAQLVKLVVLLIQQFSGEKELELCVIAHVVSAHR